jgi:hypothetical protein
MTTNNLGTNSAEMADREGCKTPDLLPGESRGVFCGPMVREGLKDEIAKKVVRQKLAKLKHLVLTKAINESYLDSLFPKLLELFHPQTVQYNGGIAKITEWKISCYLEVMDGGIPTTQPNTQLLSLFNPLLDTCNDLFLHWFKQKSACNSNNDSSKELKCTRLMTFITRYTPAPGEQALLKVKIYLLIPQKCWEIGP